MNSMSFSRSALAFVGSFLALDTALLAQAPVRTGTATTMVVSATKSEEDPLDVPAPVSVISGDELRRHGAKTVAEALQDVAGLDTGNGSDNGSRLANNQGIRPLTRRNTFYVAPPRRFLGEIRRNDTKLVVSGACRGIERENASEFASVNLRRVENNTYRLWRRSCGRTAGDCQTERSDYDGTH